jgi:hypothetical protein
MRSLNSPDNRLTTRSHPDADETAAYNRPPASNHPLEDVLRRIEMETAVELGAGDVTGPITSKEDVSECDLYPMKR